jgi:ubiquinone/menaquinone biosynthesis C-methylase UbiE
MTDFLERYYGDHAATYDALRLDGDPELELTAAVFRAHRKPPALVVDVGCGTARYGARLAAHGYEVTGVDSNPEQLRHAKGVDNLVCASSTQMPFEDEAFDGGIAILMIHQLDEVERVLSLREFFRVLRPNGVFVVKTCSDDDLRARWVENFFPSALRLNLERYPNLDDLRNEIAQTGFEVRSVVTTETLPWIPTERLLASVRDKHNTTLAAVPAAEFADGLARLAQHLSSHDRVVVPQVHTHVVFQKPGEPRPTVATGSE